MSQETTALEAREKQPVQTEGTRPGPVFRPDVDILEGPDGFLIYADLPGVEEGSVDIRLENGTLTLDTPPVATPDARWTPLHTEYRTGAYHRQFRIGEGIDASRVSASMKNGVLELVLPKSAEQQPRQIEVRAG